MGKIREYKNRLDWPKRVCLLHEWPNDVSFKLECSCGDNEHGATLWLERDEEFPHYITLRIYGKFTAYSYGARGFRERLYWFWRRTCRAVRWIFCGWLDMEEEIMIEGEDHIRSLIDALEDSLEYMKKGG